MADQPRPSRTSGAPAWAIVLGLGTAEESAARTPATKWAVRAFWTVILTAAFTSYYAVAEGPDAVSVNGVVLMALLAVLLLMSWGLGNKLYLRQRT